MGRQGKDLLKLLCQVLLATSICPFDMCDDATLSQNLRRRMTAQIEGKMLEQSEEGEELSACHRS